MREKVSVDRVILAILCLATFGVMLYAFFIQDEPKPSDRPLGTIKIETSLPADGQKIKLTQEQVNEDMKIYMSHLSKSTPVAIIIPGMFAMIGLAVFISQLRAYIIYKRMRNSEESESWITETAETGSDVTRKAAEKVVGIGSVVFGGVFAGFTGLIALIIILSTVGQNKAIEEAQTEDANVKVELILDKSIKTTTDEDGDKTTTYYLDISWNGSPDASRNVSVDEKVYSYVQDYPAKYYMARATNGIYFAAYSTDVYEFTE